MACPVESFCGNGIIRRTFAISAVRPLGPGAVPLLALARLCRRSCGGSSNGVAGVKWRMSLVNGVGVGVVVWQLGL